MIKQVKDISILDTLESAFVASFKRQDSGLQDERPEYHDFVAFYEAIFNWKMPAHIREVAAAVADSLIAELLILVPPGHSKTTTLCALMAWLLGRNPNLRIMVASHTIMYSQRLIEMTCNLLEQPISRLLFGDLIPEPNLATRWTSTERFLRRTDFRLKDPSLSAVAVGSSTIGGRCDLIIADDLVTQSNSLTDTMRKHVWNWWSNSLMTRLDKGGRIIMAGTRFYKNDLYGILKSKDFQTINLPSTVERPLWPEQKDANDLAKVKELDYFAYMAQYCLDPIDFTGLFLKEEWLSYYLAEPPNMRYYIGVDPCVKGGPDTDPMALVVIGTDINRAIHVVEVVERHANKRGQLELVKQAIRKYNAVLCGVEANAAQTYILEDLEAEGVHRSRLMGIQTSLPKGMRFINMSNHFRTGKALLPGVLENGFLHPHPGIQPLVDQWKNFPSPQDHILDALEIAIQAAIEVIVAPGVAISTVLPFRHTITAGGPDEFESNRKARSKYGHYRPIFH